MFLGLTVGEEEVFDILFDTVTGFINFLFLGTALGLEGLVEVETGGDEDEEEEEEEEEDEVDEFDRVTADDGGGSFKDSRCIPHSFAP